MARLALLPQSDEHQNCDQEVAVLVPDGSGNIFCVEIYLEMFSTAILLTLIQEGQLSISVERMGTSTG